LGFSIFYSSKKIRENENSSIIIVDEPGTPPPLKPSPDFDKRAPGSPVQPLKIANCVDQPEYLELRKLLGIEVNKTLEKRQKPEEFAKLIDDFRLKNGIPLPLGIASPGSNHLDIVFDNCKTTCHGKVFQVFVSNLLSQDQIELRSLDGTLKRQSLHASGLQTITIDQLDKKGVPFRSWIAPMSDGPWFILKTKLFLKLDISGLALEITAGESRWRVVSMPREMGELKEVPPLKIPGCNLDEQCLQTGGLSKKVSFFKAPRVCAEAVKHASDEPSQN
jgi:hypothetical protein